MYSVQCAVSNFLRFESFGIDGIICELHQLVKFSSNGARHSFSRMKQYHLLALLFSSVIIFYSTAN